MRRLSDKIALITGGTTGIGYAAAQLFRDEGATVIVTGANDANVAKAAASLGVEAVCSDVTSMADIAALMDRIKARHGRIDVLFANAGAPGERHSVMTASEAVFDSIMNLNLKGLYFTVQGALRLMPDGGSIVLTASVAAHTGLSHGAIYAASKAGVRSFGRGIAAEMLPRKIRVNTLTPGLIETPLMDKFEIPAAQMRALMLPLVPVGRIGEPMEAAAAALFLACSESSFMTGAEIIVSGGQVDL